MTDSAPTIGTDRVKRGMAHMLKGGVIMDVVTAEQAKIAEDAGAVAVMALERVPADIRGDLFDPFVTTKRGGQGLGLALVAKLVADAGGLIACESRPGRTIFRLALPMPPVVQAAPPAARAVDRSPSSRAAKDPAAP